METIHLRKVSKYKAKRGAERMLELKEELIEKENYRDKFSQEAERNRIKSRNGRTLQKTG